jgi:hypothetical protein
MRPAAIVCVVLGHKWRPISNGNDPELLLRCLRCGRTQDAGDETSSLPSVEQRIRPTDRFGNRLP